MNRKFFTILPAIAMLAAVISISACKKSSDEDNSGSNTTPPPTCGTPAGLSVTVIDANNVQLKWNAVSGATSYNIQYRPSSSSTWINATATASPKSISGLTASTAYNWQIQAVCSSGSSGFAASNFTTASPPTCSVSSTCKDGVKNGTETGVDCGGGSCNTCPTASPGGVSAILDGCLWVATSIDLFYTSTTAMIMTCSTADGRSIQFGITGSSVGVGNHVLPNPKVTISGVTYSGTNSGTLSITKFDTTNKLMSGTYYYSASNGGVKYVSSGVFTDVPYHN